MFGIMLACFSIMHYAFIKNFNNFTWTLPEKWTAILSNSILQTFFCLPTMEVRFETLKKLNSICLGLQSSRKFINESLAPNGDSARTSDLPRIPLTLHYPMGGNKNILTYLVRRFQIQGERPPIFCQARRRTLQRWVVIKIQITRYRVIGV